MPTMVKEESNTPWRIVAFVTMIAVVLSLAMAGLAIKFRFDDQAKTTQLNEVVHQLQVADSQRNCTSRSTAVAFATILDLLGTAFGTPPAPDPDRQKAVAGFHAAAEFFRHPPAATPRC